MAINFFPGIEILHRVNFFLIFNLLKGGRETEIKYFRQVHFRDLFDFILD